MHNKLVRDNIPVIIKKSGKKPIVSLADHKKLISLLKQKLIEEAEETNRAYSKKMLKEEIADVLQVLVSLSEELDISWEEIIKKMQTKKLKRGAYKKAYILEKVIEK